MLPLANVLDLFADILTGLGGRGFIPSLFLLGHGYSAPPPRSDLSFVYSVTSSQYGVAP
jgi:hypothetical protein